jgi:hypothetical protein
LLQNKHSLLLKRSIAAMASTATIIGVIWSIRRKDTQGAQAAVAAS